MASLLYVVGRQTITALHLIGNLVVCTACVGALTNVTAINAGLRRSVHGVSMAVLNEGWKVGRRQRS
jgi:hypothetical protein